MFVNALSRRELLRSGVLAGIALSLCEGRSVHAANGYVTHVPVDEQLNRITQLDGGQHRKHVAVLGAGMAGLAAAYELHQRGHNAVVFEGSSRIGGRVWTKRFTTGAYHELGAMRIPASHDYTRHYIDGAGLKSDLRPFVTAYEDLNCFLHLRGGRSRINNAGPIDFYSQLGYELTDAQHRVATRQVPPAIFGMILVNEVSLLTDDDIASLFGLRQVLTPRARYLSRTSLREFLLSRLCGNHDALELIGATTGLEVWWHESVGMFIRDEITKNGEGLDQLSDGMERLPRALAIKLGATYGEGDSRFTLLSQGPRIRLNQQILEIAISPLSRATVRLRVGHLSQPSTSVPEAPIGSPTGEHWECFDHVICTIPFTVLRGLPLKGFSPAKIRTIRNLGYTSSTKVLLHCTERFWENKYSIFGGASFSDQITRATYYPSDNAPTNVAAFRGPVAAAPRGLTPGGSFAPRFAPANQAAPDAFLEPREDAAARAKKSKQPAVLVASYSWGHDAMRMGRKTPRERMTACTDVIRAFHPEITDFLVKNDEMASIAWDNHPWAQGAFCFYQPGDMEEYFQDAIRPEGNVHFAGEHCSQDQGWIQGSLISALRAVEEVVGAN